MGRPHSILSPGTYIFDAPSTPTTSPSASTSSPFGICSFVHCLFWLHPHSFDPVPLPPLGAFLAASVCISIAHVARSPADMAYPYRQPYGPRDAQYPNTTLGDSRGGLMRRFTTNALPTLGPVVRQQRRPVVGDNQMVSTYSRYLSSILRSTAATAKGDTSGSIPVWNREWRCGYLRRLGALNSKRADFDTTVSLP